MLGTVAVRHVSVPFHDRRRFFPVTAKHCANLEMLLCCTVRVNNREWKEKRFMNVTRDWDWDWGVTLNEEEVY